MHPPFTLFFAPAAKGPTARDLYSFDFESFEGLAAAFEDMAKEVHTHKDGSEGDAAQLVLSCWFAAGAPNKSREYRLNAGPALLFLDIDGYENTWDDLENTLFGTECFAYTTFSQGLKQGLRARVVYKLDRCTTSPEEAWMVWAEQSARLALAGLPVDPATADSVRGYYAPGGSPHFGSGLFLRVEHFGEVLVVDEHVRSAKARGLVYLQGSAPVREIEKDRGMAIKDHHLVGALRWVAEIWAKKNAKQAAFAAEWLSALRELRPWGERGGWDACLMAGSWALARCWPTAAASSIAPFVVPCEGYGLHETQRQAISRFAGALRRMVP